MCGILGYYGPKNAAQVVIDGLKKLEYRGYDSAGIAIPNGLGFFVHKNAGRVADVFSNFSLNGFSGGIAIGHTRWATHGGVTAANAHPHLSNNGKIAVAHNGIIENYQELRDQLIGEGFVFKSQTDTEVIPILIEKFMRQGKNFVDATKETLKTVEGSWAIAAYHIDEKKLIGARHESPLVFGVGDGEFFLGSDIPAFLDYTKKVIDLDDKEMVVVGEGGYQLFSLAKNIPVGRAPYLIDWDAEQAKKGNFDHFMIKEIMEQAEVIKRAIAQDKNIVMKIADEIKNAKDVYLIACGTAFHGCISASYVFAKIAKKSVRPIYAHEFPQFAEFLGPESLVIAVSQSGETADTLNAIRIAKERGAKVFSITNGMGSSLARESTGALIQKAGPEICVVSTKAYTSQQAIQAMLAYSMIGKYDECISALKNLVMMIFYLTSENARVYTKNLAEKLRYAQHIYLLGRGMLYPAALEAALKIKEVSYIHAEAYAGGELKHGNIALIEHGTPCIIFTNEETEREILSNAAELKARGAYIIGVGPKNNELFDYWIKVWDAGIFNSVVQTIPMQILAYQLAILRGCDPDKPRNLAKSVTVK
ncbi:MAG TPA: glutamine--fructose-6-phosphate transaminase (isomerizing) [archaeon]|nr:glutamine--fructose-6-phosphate transaminase (isomerizing) [archaeon]